MFAAAPVAKGAFVAEYLGEVISVAAADVREARYEAVQGGGTGALYLFRLNETHVVDATRKVGGWRGGGGVGGWRLGGGV